MKKLLWHCRKSKIFQEIFRKENLREGKRIKHTCSRANLLDNKIAEKDGFATVPLFVILLCLSNQALAANQELLVQIKDHKFIPETLSAPSSQKFTLIVENLDKTLEEFESSDLKKEKIVSGNKKIIINLGPLKPGEYKFFGDFHQKTAQGKLVVK